MPPSLHDSHIIGAVGKGLNSLTFVWDYYQLEFHDNLVVTVLNPSWLMRDREKTMDTSPLFPHHLRGLFGAEVIAIRFEEMILQIEWSTGTTLHIGFRTEDYFGPEGLHINSPDVFFEIW